MSNQITITGGAKVRNLEGVLTGTSGLVGALPINVANGIPQLDSSGKILVSQLPNSVMEFKGVWNAATNTPTLANGTGNTGDVWLCNVAGTVNFGSGPVVFAVGDYAVYDGATWQKSSGATGTVTSVAVSETSDALTITGSPITTSGTINIGFAGSSSQYVRGDGGLSTFSGSVLDAHLTGFVATQGVVSSADTVLTGLEKIAANALDISSTGVYVFAGLTLASSTTFNVGAAKGFIVDNTTNISFPTVIEVNYAGATGLTDPNLTTSTETYVMLDNTGTLVLQPTFPTPQERRQKIFLGKLGHPDKISFLNAFSQPDLIQSPLSQLRDVFTPINLINGGVYPSPNGANLQFNTSAGTLYGLGINFINNPLAPSTYNVSAQAPTTFRYRTQTGGTGSNITNLDPTSYDLNGTVTAISGAGGRATNQRIYCLQNGQIRVQYGQEIYNSLTDAIQGIQTETFITFPNFIDNAILIGILSVTKNCTDLTVSNKAKILLVSKFGESVGSAGGVSTTTLQQAYNNSIQPEIITNSTLGAVTFRRGSTADTDNVLEVQNGAGTNTAYVDGLGDFTANKYVKTGGTSAQFLKADGSVDSSSYLVLGSLSATSPLAYNSGTGAFSIQVANTSQNGYLSSTDWNTFNGKLSTATADATYVSIAGSVQTITGTKRFDSGVQLKYGAITSSTGYAGIGADNDRFYFSNAGGIQSLIFSTTNAYSYTFPSASGTLALASSLSSYVPYTGATGAVNLGSNTFTANTLIAFDGGTYGYLGMGPTYSSGTYSMYTGAATDLTLGTNNLQAVRVFSNQNVLIGSGSTNAGYKLDVNGTGRVTASLGIATTSATNGILETNGRIVASDGGGASRLALNIESNTSATAYSAINSYNYGTSAGRPLAINESGGNVMINTTTDAGYKLDVNGTSRFSGALSGTSATFSSYVDGLGLRANGSSGFGSTGVGVEIGWSGTLGYVQAYNRSTSAYQPMKVDGSTLSLQISGVEKLGIASTGAATFSSLGTGTVTATSGTLSTVSDMNLKVEDGYINNALDKVMNLKPRYFHWKKESGLPTDLRQLGFYAQEVNQALGEEAANTPKTENDKWGIYDRGMIAFLTAAIQEQQSQIDELKALINK